MSSKADSYAVCEEIQRIPAYRLDGGRHKGGMNVTEAFKGNVGNSIRIEEAKATSEKDSRG